MTPLSLSCTEMPPASKPNPLAVAVMMAVWGPSMTVSSTIVTSNVALNCPANIVTDAGTVTLPVLREASVTTALVSCTAESVTEPLPTNTPSPSVATAGNDNSNCWGAGMP